MAKTNIKIIRLYDGTKSVKEAMTDAIVAKVRKNLDSDIEIIKRKEYNLGNTQDMIYPSLSGLCG